MPTDATLTPPARPLYGAFKLATAVSLAGWAALLLAPLWSHAARAVAGLAVLLLALLYVFLVFFARRWDAGAARPKGSFFALEGVLNILRSPRAALGAWVHILVFDLWVGCWITLDAAQQHMPHFYAVPTLLLTMMFGPAGFLAYVVLRYFMLGAALPGF